MEKKDWTYFPGCVNFGITEKQNVWWVIRMYHMEGYPLLMTRCLN
jgi:hypothetical protein